MSIRKLWIGMLGAVAAIALCCAVLAGCDNSSSPQTRYKYSVTVEGTDTISVKIESDLPFSAGVDLDATFGSKYSELRGEKFRPVYGKHLEGLYLQDEKVADENLILLADVASGSKLVPRYTFDAFRLSLNAMGGKIPQQQSEYNLRYASRMPQLPVPEAPAGAEFVGWMTDTSVIVTDEKAQYKTAADQSLNCHSYGEIDDTMTGFTGFGGYWEKDGVVCLYAAYRAAEGSSVSGTVTLDADGGYCVAAAKSLALGAKNDLPKAYRPHGTFARWLYNDRFVVESGRTWYLYGDITLKALYNSKEPEGVIFTADDFLAMSGGGKDTSYILATDIDFSGKSWEPFALAANLDGNGYTVKGLKANARAGDLAPFSAVSGKIKNITFEVDIESASYTEVAVGGVCAVLQKGGSLTGVTVKGKIAGNRCIIGGLAGRMEDGEIVNSTVRGTVVGDNATVGGLVGKQSGGSVTECENYAEVSSTSYETGVRGGGLCGYLESGVLSDCENYGAVTVRTACGGIVGQMNLARGTTLNGVVNHAQVSGHDYVGGVVGYIPDVPHLFALSGLSNEGAVSGENYTGGVIGYLYCRVEVQDDQAHVNTAGKMNNSGTVTGGDNTGGIFGYFFGDLYSNYLRRPSFVLRATELANTGDITGKTQVGGLFGYAFTDNTQSVIEGCSSSGAVTAEAVAGCVAGKLESVRIIDCENDGSALTVTGYVTEGEEYLAYAGGFVGYGYEVSECVNAVNIEYSGLGGKIGGIAGFLNGNVYGCENTGNVLALQSDYVGGIVGEIKFGGAFSVLDLINRGNVGGKTHIGGAIGAVNCNYSGSDVSSLRRISNYGSVTAANLYGGLFGVINARSLSASEFKFAGQLQSGSAESVYGVFGARVATQTESSALTGWEWIIDGEPFVGELPDRELICETENFGISR